MKDDYARMAPIYDTATLPFLLFTRRRISRIMERHGCRNVLDLCTGTGQQAIHLDRAGIPVTGVDLSPSMIAIARSKSPSRIPYFLEDATRLHFKDASFDGVVLSLSLHEMVEPLRAGILAEVRRVLAPGGILVVLDYVRPGAPRAGFPFTVVNLVERLAGFRHHLNYRDFLLRGATGACLERHGMRVVETEERLFGTMVLVTAVPDGR